MAEASPDVTPRTRDDAAIIDACEHLDSYPLSNDVPRLSQGLYTAFNDPLDNNTYSAEITRQAFVDASIGTAEESVLQRLFDWYDDLGGDVTVEISRAGSGAVKIHGGAAARDNRYPPLTITTTYPTSGRPSVSIEGAQYHGYVDSLWVGAPDELTSEEIVNEAAEAVMPSVTSRTSEFEEAGLRGRRATVLALTEAGLSDEEMADVLPIKEPTIRSMRSKASASTREAERLTVSRLGEPKTILVDTEIVAGGGFPRRYYLCEHVTDEVAYLVVVEEKDAGMATRTMEYDTIGDLVESHESEAEFMGWEETLQAAVEQARNT